MIRPRISISQKYPEKKNIILYCGLCLRLPPHSCIMKGELKKSVLQSLKEFQARAKAQEQENKEVEKSKAHKKGDVEL